MQHDFSITSVLPQTLASEGIDALFIGVKEELDNRSEAGWELVSTQTLLARK